MKEGVKVKPIEEFMVLKVLNVASTKAFGRILDQKFTDQVSCYLRYTFRNSVLYGADTILNRVTEGIDATERGGSGEHLIDNHSKGPQIEGTSHRAVLDSFGSQVLFSANELVFLFIIGLFDIEIFISVVRVAFFKGKFAKRRCFDSVRGAKVSQYQLKLLVNKQVSWFKISMNNVLALKNVEHVY